MQLLEFRCDRVALSFVGSNDLVAAEVRDRRAAAIRGDDVTGEIACEIWASKG
jgi:hypothetical protein